MRVLPAALLMFAALAACDVAQADETITPRPACVAFDMAASVDFGADGKPLYFDHWATAQIVRDAQACRFRRITLTMFTDGADRALADDRATVLKAMLIQSHWPQEAIAIDTQPMRLAPSGKDGAGVWTAKALIGFADPDPGFVPAMEKPGETCSVDPKTNTSQCKPMPWFHRRTSRIYPPPSPHDPPGVYYYANAWQLDDRALEAVAEGLQIFRRENYSRIVLLYAAGPDETAPQALALRRANGVRDALIHMGMDPSRIVVEKDPTLADPGARDRDAYVNRHVIIDFED